MRSPGRSVVVVVLAASGGACSLGALDGFSGGGLTEAGAAPDVASASDASDASDAAAVVTDATSEGPVACTAGARVSAIRAFDPSPTPGFSCAPENAFVEDAKLAGIDRGPSEGLLDGDSVTGCLGVELASAVDQLTVRMKPIAQGCLTPCSTTNCGTGHDAKIFVGTSAAALKYSRGVTLTSLNLMDYVMDFGLVPDLRFFAVCRTVNGDSRDDIAVDVIHGRCGS